MIATHAGIQVHRRIVARTRKAIVELRLADSQVCLPHLRSHQLSPLIHSLSLGNGGKGHGITHLNGSNVKWHIVRHIDDVLHLQHIVINLCLSLHDVILTVGHLRLQLQQLILGYLALLQQLLATAIKRLILLQQLAVHLQRLTGVENLHIELGDLLLNPVKINIALQVSLFREQLRQADIVASLIAVPDGPTGIHAVGAVVGNLVGIHACHFLQERRIVHTMAGAGRERRQPLSLLLHHVHTLLLSLRPGTRNISAVPLGKVQYLPQRPLPGLGKVHHIVVGSGRQHPARLTVILRKTRQRQTCQDHGGKSASHFYHTAGIIGIILSNNVYFRCKVTHFD